MMVLAAAFALMLVGFYLLAWSPQNVQLADLEQQRVAAEKNIDLAKSQLVMLSGIKNEAISAEAELVKISTAMPPTPELPAFVLDLQGIANDSGVELVSLNPTPPVSVGEYSTMQVALALNGSYTSTIDFLHRIEQATRAMKVNTIQLQTDATKYPNLDVMLQVQAFTMSVADSSTATPPAQSASAMVTTTPGQAGTGSDVQASTPPATGVTN